MNLLPIAKPSGEIASAIHKRFRIKLINSLKALSESLIVNNKYNLNLLLNELNNISVDHPFNPSLYIWHWELLEGMRSGNGSTVQKSIYNIQKIIDENLYRNGFEVNTISNTIEHQIIKSKLEEHPVPDKQGRLTVMNSVGAAEVSKYRNDILDSLNIIKNANSEMLIEIEEYIREIVITKGSGVNGASSIQFFGMVFLREPGKGFHNAMYFLEHLVHETSHHHLFSFQACDSILINPNELLYNSPLRRDPRPMLGVMHGEFVLSRMVHIFRRCVENGAPQVFNARLETLEKKFEIGRKVIQEHANFTEFGNRLFISMKELAK